MPRIVHGLGLSVDANPTLRARSTRSGVTSSAIHGDLSQEGGNQSVNDVETFRSVACKRFSPVGRSFLDFWKKATSFWLCVFFDEASHQCCTKLVVEGGGFRLLQYME